MDHTQKQIRLSLLIYLLYFRQGDITGQLMDELECRPSREIELELLNERNIDMIPNLKSAQTLINRRDQLMRDLRWQERAVTFFRSLAYRWQVELHNILEGEIDSRKVIWMFDRVGNVGKTEFKVMTKSLNLDNVIMLDACEASEFKYICAHDKPNARIVIVDVPRSINTQEISYDAIEAVKQGSYTSTKYEPITVLTDPPHMVIMSNSLPMYKSLSVDRWIIGEIVSIDQAPVANPIKWHVVKDLGNSKFNLVQTSYKEALQFYKARVNPRSNVNNNPQPAKTCRKVYMPVATVAQSNVQLHPSAIVSMSVTAPKITTVNKPTTVITESTASNEVASALNYDQPHAPADRQINAHATMTSESNINECTQKPQKQFSHCSKTNIKDQPATKSAKITKNSNTTVNSDIEFSSDDDFIESSQFSGLSAQDSQSLSQCSVNSSISSASQTKKKLSLSSKLLKYKRENLNLKSENSFSK